LFILNKLTVSSWLVCIFFSAIAFCQQAALFIVNRQLIVKNNSETII